MGLRRLAISNPIADTDTTLFTADNQYLMSVIATNLSASASDMSVWIEPSGSSASADYAYIVYDLPVDAKNSYETFRFAVNQNDVVKIRTNSNDMSFQSYGLVQFDVNLGVGVSSFQSASPTAVVDGLIWVDSDATGTGGAKPAYVWDSNASQWVQFIGGIDTSLNYNFTGNNVFDGTTSLSSSTTIGVISASSIATLNSPTFTGTVILPSTTSIGNISSTEIQYLDNVTGNIQTQINSKAPTSSPTFTGVVTADNYDIGLTTLNSDSISLDFSSETGLYTRSAAGTITFTGSNYREGSIKTVRIIAGGSNRTLNFPTNWIFVGQKPTTIDANKTAILTVTSFGTTEANCVSAWAVQQ